MSFWEIVLLGVGLSMDAIAVSVSDRLVYRNISRAKLIAIPIFFGVFQAVMPAIGFFAGSIFTSFIEQVSGVLVFLILGAIGGKMIWDGFHPECIETGSGAVLTYRTLSMQAIATSIDALAVGVGFAAMQVSVLTSCVAIGVTTTVLCGAAVFFGSKLRSIIGSRAHLFGGIILLLIGTKALIS